MAEIQGTLGNPSYDSNAPTPGEFELVATLSRPSEKTEFIRFQILNASEQSLIGAEFDIGFGIRNINSETVRIAMQDLRKIAIACQLDPSTVKDTNQLCNIPFIAELYYGAKDVEHQYPKLRNHKAKIRGTSYTPPAASFGGLPQHSQQTAQQPAQSPFGQPQQPPANGQFGR